MLNVQFLKNIKSFIKNNKTLSIFLLFLVVLIPVLVFAVGDPSTSYRVNPGETRTIQYYAYDGSVSPISYHLVNPPTASSKSYFIPTRTIREFDALYSNCTWDESYTSLSLEDYCGNGLCGYCVAADYTGSTAQRLKASPSASNLRFEGYSYNCEEQSDCPADCGSVYCGDGTCEYDYYENSTICSALVQFSHSARFLYNSCNSLDKWNSSG